MNCIRMATQDDADVIADLIHEKRLQYEGYQSIFWRIAPHARENHRGFLAQVLADAHTLAMVWEALWGGWRASLLPTSLRLPRCMRQGARRVWWMTTGFAAACVGTPSGQLY